MQLFILGVVLVFVKLNLQFIDTGVFFYVTNTIGYILIYSSIRTYYQSLQGVKRMQTLVFFMIIHSIGIAALNGTGNSLKTIALLTWLDEVFAIILLLLSVIGMFMIFYILDQFILALRKERNSTSILSSISNFEIPIGLLVLLLIISGVLFFILPTLSNIFMLILLIGELLFVFFFSNGVKSTWEKT